MVAEYGSGRTTMVKDRVVVQMIFHIRYMTSWVTQAVVASSSTKGTHINPTKGQPTIAPIASHVSPPAVLAPPRLFMNMPSARKTVYMAKADGKYATEAWNMPALETRASKKKRAMRGFMLRATVA